MEKAEVLQMLELERLTQPKHELGQRTKKAIEAAMKLIRSIENLENIELKGKFLLCKEGE